MTHIFLIHKQKTCANNVITMHLNLNYNYIKYGKDSWFQHLQDL